MSTSIGPDDKREFNSLDEDIRDHLERETQDNIDRGMSPDEARRAARIKFGNVTRVKEDARDAWRTPWLDQLMQDLRYGLRMLRNAPGFTAVVVATLALGLGMNTAIFSVFYGVLLRPLPYPDSDRLIWLSNHHVKFQQDTYGSRTDFLLWKQQARSFEAMTAYGNEDLAMVAEGEASQERIAYISGDFWNISGAQPAIGRLFRSGEPNAIVLSWPLFERRFHADPAALGKNIALNGFPFTIVGILPKNLRFLLPQQFAPGDEFRGIDAYIPVPDAVMAMPTVRVQEWQKVTNRYGPVPYWIRVVGRLKRGVSFETTRSEMEAIYARVVRENPTPLRADRILTFASLQDKLATSARQPLMILSVSAAFVLLIACANIASLLLVRTSHRQKEIAIRAAIGAGRMRVVRQFLAESMLLALGGCAAGLLVARAALQIVIKLAPAGMPRLDEVSVDGRAVLFTLVISFGSGLAFGLGPALAILKAEVLGVLKNETATSTSAGAGIRLRSVLVAAQLALAVILLAGSGLLMKSLWRMNARPAGFSPENILVMRVSLSGERYATWPAKQAYAEEMLRTLRSETGVLAAGIDGGMMNANVQVGTNPDSLNDGIFASIRGVSPGYLEAIGVLLLKGRWPGPEDLFGVVVNEAFARRFSESDFLGKRVSGLMLNDTIVGVVADFKSWQLDAEPAPEIYMRYERLPIAGSMRVVVRTSGNAASFAPAIRRAISRVDRTQPVYEFQTLEDALAASIAQRRFNLFLLGAFAATALLLALMGIYGVIAYYVSQRRREIGIRLALGAQRSNVLGSVVGQGMTIALSGIAIGVAAALMLTQYIANLLYRLKPNDPTTFVVVSILSALIALLATSIPALKAARLDPVTTLRSE